MHEGHRKRMLDKLLDGKSLLSEHELLEILLFYCIPRKNVNETAHLLLDHFGSLQGVMNASQETLMTVPGIGQSTAAFFTVLKEIQSRIEQNDALLPEIVSYDNCKQYLISCFKGLSEEKFIALYLNSSGKIIFRTILCSHSESMVEIDLYKLTSVAVLQKAKRVIVAHNHLSGSCKPSDYDNRATEKIFLSLRSASVTLADHIIVSGDNSFSYKASGSLRALENKYNAL